MNVTQSYRIHPIKFGLWVGLASITMMFIAFTSAYIVRQSAGNWLEFMLPNMFFVSTGALLLSSLTLQASYHFFKKENFSYYKIFMTIAFLLGIAFVILQYEAWTEMYSIGIELSGNPSGSFIYIISGVHAAHVLGGIAGLSVALIQAFSLAEYVSPKRLLRFELVLQYWHFVDFLWIYLLIFFIIQR